MDPSAMDAGTLPLEASDKLAIVSSTIDQLEKEVIPGDDQFATPQKNMNKKKLKAQNGEAIDTNESDVGAHDNGSVEGVDTSQTYL